MKVPFVNLELPTQQIKDDYLKALNDFLDRGIFILTPEVNDFEEQWAKMINVKYCLGVSSGTDALYLALRALEIGSGDEVIIQGNAYNVCVTAILRVGATPRFVDINEDTLTIDTHKIEPLINNKTKAILPVHLYGQGNDMEAIMLIAKKHNLMVVGDCSQAHLAEFKGRTLGSYGDVAVFSFYPTKNLGAFGDAGAIVTDNLAVRDKIMALRNLGETAKNQHDYLGYNMRLDPIQAICLSLKLPYLRTNIESRRQLGQYYDELLVKFHLPVQPVAVSQDAKSVYHLYVVKCLSYNRDQLKNKLLDLGIQTAIHYPVPVYHQPFYHGPVDDCPVVDKTISQIISLPFYPGMTKQQQEYVIESIGSIINN